MSVALVYRVYLFVLHAENNKYEQVACAEDEST